MRANTAKAFPSAPGRAHSQKHRVARTSADGLLARAAALQAPEQLPQGNAQTTGSWTELGPAPEVGLKDCCTGAPPQPTSVFGNVGGRITSMAVVPGTAPQTVFLGTAGGGVWKGDSQHQSWTVLTDGQPSLAIGAIAVDSSGQKIFAGTGEDNQSDSQPGQGILKSTDGGATWSLVGQNIFAGHHIGSIAIDNRSSDPLTVYVASDVGLYVSTDSGSTWQQITLAGITGLNGSPPPTGAATLVIQDPSAPSRFWVAVSDFCQTEAGDVYLGDFASGFTRITPPAFSSNSVVASRLGLGVGTGGVAYLSAANCNGDLVDLEQATNGGFTWSGPLHTPGSFNYFNFGVPQGYYDNTIAVDPFNSNIAIFGGVTVMATLNGGASFSDIGVAYNGGVIHPDVHAIEFAPSDSDRMLVGTDGGLWSSTDDGGLTHAPPFGTNNDWNNENGNLAAIQYYAGSALDASDYAGGAQDNGTSGRFTGLSLAPPAWQSYFGGDGGNTALIGGTPTMYAEVPGMILFKGSSSFNAADPAAPDDGFAESGPCRSTSNPPDPACGEPSAFVAPFFIDPSNTSRVFAATNHVWVSSSGGAPPGPSSAGGSWGEISPDLTFGTSKTGTNFPDRIQALAGGNATAGIGVVMTASLEGRVYMTSNATAATPTWTEITGNLPPLDLNNFIDPNAWIDGIAFNPSNPSEAWVVMGGVNVGHIFHTVNAGAVSGTTWSDISGSGATGVPNAGVDAIALDPTDPNTVYIGTDSTVMVCTTCGGMSPSPNWMIAGAGLPDVKVNGLGFSHDGNTLFAWTHGRGAWSMPRASFLAAPRSFQFSTATSGTNPSAQPLTVSAPNATTVTVDLTQSPSWLHVTPSSVSPAPGSPQSFSVSVDTTGLVGASYAGTFGLNPGGGRPEAILRVSLEVARFPGAYRPVVPFRVLDTRNGIGHNGALGPGQKISVTIAGVPGSGVPGMGSPTPPSAVVLNVTATNPTQPSYLTVYPGADSTCQLGVNCVPNPNGPPNPPLASNLNFTAGQTVPNLVEVAIGDDGTVSLYNAQGSVDVIFDVEGWITRQGATTGSSGFFNPLVPARIMDTRDGTGGHSGALQAGQTATLQVTGSLKDGGGASGVPASGVSGVVLNVTVTNAAGAPSSYLTLYPSDASRPTASNLNFVSGQTVPNRVMVKLSATGQVSIFNAAGSVNVVIDVGGWYTDGTINTTGSQFTGLTPSRILDTRDGTGAPLAPVCAGQTITINVAGRGGVPSIPTAKAVVMNVTATDTTAGSYLTVYPTDAASRPTASDLNWVPGLTVPNLVVVKLSTLDGTVAIYNAQGCVDVIADVVGWYG